MAEQETHFIYVKIPAALEPIDRFNIEDPLEELLEEHNIGYVSGGGTMLSGPDENGARGIEYCGIDVDVYDLAQGVSFLKAELPKLNLPLGVTLEFTENGQTREVAVN